MLKNNQNHIMFNYTLTSIPWFNVNTKTIDTIFETVYKVVDVRQKWMLNIIFMDNENIKILNKNYRNIDKATDVLSFHYFDDFSSLKKDDIAWEIIMSQEKIVEQWNEYWLWEEKEFYKLLIHSILHILWYDHENDDDFIIMQKLEEIIWKEVFEK